MIKWSRNKIPPAALGLVFSAGHLQAVHASRDKSSLKVLGTLETELSLDLLTADPELMARELRNHLDGAKISERHCIVGLPASWAVTIQTSLPQGLVPEDEAGLLAIDAEKGFPCDPALLQIALSRASGNGANFVSQIGIRRELIDRLSSILRLAGLRPLSYTLALPALADTPRNGGDLLLTLDPAQPALLLRSGGGIVRLRTLDLIIDSEAGHKVLADTALLRELRVSLEQVPAELRDNLRTLRLCGSPALVQQAAGVLRRWSDDRGFTLECNENADTSLGLAAASRIVSAFLSGLPPAGLEFLPPREHRLKQWLARYNSRRLTTIGLAAGVLVAVAALAFSYIEIRAWMLRSEWTGIRAEVTDLEGTQAKIREFRSWHDNSCVNMGILKLIAEAFPDNGTVTAKTLEVRNTTLVTVTGTTRDNTALLKVLDLLRHRTDIHDLKVDQIRGKSPAQFTFTFRVNGGSGS